MTDTRPLVLLDVDHGDAGYRAGCRCGTCKQSNTLRMALYREAKSGANVVAIDRIEPRGRRAGPNRRLIDDRPEWMADAACKGLDPDLFVPPVAKGPGGDNRYDEARAVCGRCTVRSECLEYAIVNRETFGVWGGTTPKQREAERRRRREGAAR